MAKSVILKKMIIFDVGLCYVQGQTNDHGLFHFKKANLLFKFNDTMTMIRNDISILVLLHFRQQFYWLVQYQNNIADGMMVNYQNDLSILRLFRVDDAIQ